MTTNKPLRRAKPTIWHFNAAGQRVEGAHENLRGNVSGLSGNVSGLSGNVTGLSGDVTGLWGDLDLIPASARPANVTDFVSEE